MQIPPGVEIGYDLELDRARRLKITESGLVVIGKGERITEAPYAPDVIPLAASMLR